MLRKSFILYYISNQKINTLTIYKVNVNIYKVLYFYIIVRVLHLKVMNVFLSTLLIITFKLDKLSKIVL